jgi:outer membrane lipoprotein SlyB
MKRLAIAATAACLMLTSVPAAQAKGCLKGAAVGAVAGHFLHHHAILGAVAGCAIGHHMAVKREQEQKGRPLHHPLPQQGQPHDRHAI